MASQDVRKFTPVSYRTSALWGRCPALTPLLQLITPSRASGTADHVRSLDDQLESNLDNKICYKVFYGQIVRFQRLCSFKHHFEERACFLLKILLERHYNLKFLKREFCKAVEKYISEFQRWAIPVSIHEWFEGLASRINSNND